MIRWASFCASLLAHASVLGASAMWTPLGGEIDEISEDQMFTFGSHQSLGNYVEPEAREPPDLCPSQLVFAQHNNGRADACRIPSEIARCYPESVPRGGRLSSPDQLGLSGIGDATPPARSPGGPHVHLGPVAITGQLDAPWRDSVNSVNEAVQEATVRVRGCYVRALRDAPTLHGRVTVRIKSEAPSGDEGGTTTHAVVKSATDITDPAFLCCVDEAQLTVFLPAARGTATAVYSLTLRPGV
jgi:hypothetical protein